MALSGHREPDAARGYVKRTEIQRAIGARKWRGWVDAPKAVQRVAATAIQPVLDLRGANK
jgi:hypothetical protein